MHPCTWRNSVLCHWLFNVRIGGFHEQKMYVVLDLLDQVTKSGCGTSCLKQVKFPLGKDLSKYCLELL